MGLMRITGDVIYPRGTLQGVVKVRRAQLQWEKERGEAFSTHELSSIDSTS